MGVTYHSIHGSIQESMHVFIDAGLRKAVETFPAGELRILEMGFGTGLNALLTLIDPSIQGRKIHYTALELFPLEQELTATLGFAECLHRPELQPAFEALHQSPWERETAIVPEFTLLKRQASLLDVSLEEKFHLVYFDAFAPASQPELWTEAVFSKLHAAMHPGGLLVTYCARGSVRRAMISAGFSVEKLPGPRGKREMLRAISQLTN